MHNLSIPVVMVLNHVCVKYEMFQINLNVPKSVGIFCNSKVRYRFSSDSIWGLAVVRWGRGHRIYSVILETCPLCPYPPRPNLIQRLNAARRYSPSDFREIKSSGSVIYSGLLRFFPPIYYTNREYNNFCYDMNKLTVASHQSLLNVVEEKHYHALDEHNMFQILCGVSGKCSQRKVSFTIKY
ncbi:hypothetical protein QTP88_017766 [Uroleucon formosanum]